MVEEVFVFTDVPHEPVIHKIVDVQLCHAAAAEKLGIADGEMVFISSRRGKISAAARVSDKTRPGECWMPFHYLEASANRLTIGALDNISATPEYKVCAVRVEKEEKK